MPPDVETTMIFKCEPRRQLGPPGVLAYNAFACSMEWTSIHVTPAGMGWTIAEEGGSAGAG